MQFLFYFYKLYFIFIFTIIQLIYLTKSQEIVSDGSVNISQWSDKPNTEERFCKEYEWNGIKIPRTRWCSQAEVLCPDYENTVGIVTQKCGCQNGQWSDKPSTKNCTHKWIGNLKSAIFRAEPAEYISKNLTKNINQTDRLFLGDIIECVSISEQLINLIKRQLDTLNDDKLLSVRAENFTREFGEAGDQLLSERVIQYWAEFDDKTRMSKAGSLMSSLEESINILANYQYGLQGQQTKIEYKTWALQVEVAPVQQAQDDAFKPTNRYTPGFAIPVAAPIDYKPPTTEVKFSNFNLSPTLSLPSIGVIQKSLTQDNSEPINDTPTQMGKDRSRPTPILVASPTMSAPIDQLKMGYHIFTSVGDLLSPNNSTIVNSLILGATVSTRKRFINPEGPIYKKADSVNLQEPVVFTFYHLKTTDVINPRCVFWDTKNSFWSREGCTLTVTTKTFTNCSCTHFTSFAILMDITGSLDFTLDPTSSAVLDIISIIGCVFSIVCLFFSTLIFSCFRSLWNIRNTIHRNLCICLLLAELFFVVGIERTEFPPLCSAFAVALHYLFLTSFCWMLLEGYQLYLMLIQVFEPDNEKLLLYYLWAYGFPAIIVAVSAGVAWPNYGTSHYCWLNVNSATVWAFVGPVSIVILVNVIFLGVAFKVVLSVKTRDKSRGERILGWLKGSATLLCLLGVTWIFGYFMVIGGAQPIFAYIFTIFNCTQGVFIFILHVILNEKVRFALIRFLRTGLCCIPDPGASYNSKSYISSRQKFANIVHVGDSFISSDQNRSSDTTDISYKSPNGELQNISRPPLGEYEENGPKKKLPHIWNGVKK